MVLICYDASPTARRAISAAHAILGDRPATVLHVWQLPKDYFEPDWLGGPTAALSAPITELEALALDRAEVVAAEGVELARRSGFAAKARAEPETGRVWRVIIDVAHDIEAEVIVVGARGLSTVRSVLLGSVSNAVVHHSHIPVLVIPPPDSTHETRGVP